jgi:hypothetical protein
MVVNKKFRSFGNILKKRDGFVITNGGTVAFKICTINKFAAFCETLRFVTVIREPLP